MPMEQTKTVSRLPKLERSWMRGSAGNIINDPFTWITDDRENSNDKKKTRKMTAKDRKRLKEIKDRKELTAMEIRVGLKEKFKEWRAVDIFRILVMVNKLKESSQLKRKIFMTAKKALEVLGIVIEKEYHLTVPIEFTYNKGDVKDMIIEKILCRIRCKWMARYITSRIRITYKKTTTIQRNLRNHRTMDECINWDSETENNKLCTCKAWDMPRDKEGHI